MAGERARERSVMRSLPIRRAGWTMALAAAVAVGATRVATEQSTADQERRSTGPDSVQERSAARSALRPAVMGGSGAVSAGHPLSTAAGLKSS